MTLGKIERYFLFAVIAGIAGLWFIGSQIRNAYHGTLLNREGITTGGRITAVTETYYRGARAYRVSYSFFVDGDTVGGKGFITKVPFPQRYRVGQSLEILYAPTHPGANCPAIDCRLLETWPGIVMALIVLGLLWFYLYAGWQLVQKESQPVDSRCGSS